MATASRKARRDRISSLPDEILTHILSFLQTHQAVATSVLSKRWRHLWTSVPTLDYDQKIYRKPSSYFEKFIYATILARDVEQPIRSFHLRYKPSDSFRSKVDINVWVNAVLQRRIEKLHIWINTNFCDTSLRIFSCRTLVVLNLRGLRVYASSPIELPSLKSLHLELVDFVKPQSLLELISGCPILEDLKVHYDESDAALGRSLCGAGVKILPKLVRADLSPYRVDVPLKAICNVEFLTMSTSQFQVDDYVVDDAVPEFPNLVHVVLKVEFGMNWPFVLDMLKNCPKLQDFELDCYDPPVEESFLPDPYLIPECLTSQFRKCSLKYCYGTESELQFAKYILQNSTTLQTMIICSSQFLSAREKHEMLKDIALCPRRSALCQLSFR